METSRKVKLAMMAATSLVAASGALAPAHAGDMDPAAFPQTVEVPVVASIAHADDQAVQKTSPITKRLGLIAVAGGVLAGLIRLIGPKKVMRVVKTSAGRTVKAAGKAAVSTAAFAGRALRSPIRYVAWIAGLALLAFTGIGFYDVEWIAGLVLGAAFTGVAAAGLVKTGMALSPVRIRRRSENMENEN